MKTVPKIILTGAILSVCSGGLIVPGAIATQEEKNNNVSEATSSHDLRTHDVSDEQTRERVTSIITADASEDTVKPVVVKSSPQPSASPSNKTSTEAPRETVVDASDREQTEREDTLTVKDAEPTLESVASEKPSVSPSPSAEETPIYQAVVDSQQSTAKPETTPSESPAKPKASEHDDDTIIPASIETPVEPGKLIISGSEADEVIVIDEDQTLGDALAAADQPAGKLQNDDNTPINKDHVIAPGETLTVFKKETSSSSEEVKIKHRVVEEETDDLLVGETEVQTEGKDGVALKTTITTSAKDADNASTAETFIVLEQPQEEVVLVGTREPEPELEATPEPVVEEVAAATQSNSSSSSSNATTSNVSNSTTTSNNVSKSSSKKSSKSSSSEKGLHGVASTAKAQLGKPYVWGATGPSSFDCSGLVQYVFAQNGKSVPRTTGAQWAASTPVSPSDIRVGDILWRPGHIGIYVGDGKIVHASSPSTGTIETTLDNWLSRGYKIGRL